MDMIELRNVGKRFRIPHEKRSTLYENVIGLLVGKKQTYSEFWALRDISLTVRKGEALGLVGRNGCGKSTLLRVIGNIYRPTTGTVQVRGHIMPFLELGVGMQQELTGRDNVYLYGAIMGMTRQMIGQKYGDIVDFSELEEFMDLRVKDYSSGMLARLAFSTAIMTDPDIMLIDEVLAVGDTAFKAKCMERMNKLWNSGRTIVFVSHQTDQVKQLCEKTVFLHNGGIGAYGPTKDVLKEYERVLKKDEALRASQPKQGWQAGLRGRAQARA